MVLLVASVLAACGKPAEVAPPPPAPPLAQAPAAPAQAATSASATAGECAAILQNVQAGRDIIVNVQCDTPTEARLIAALSGEKWDVLCPHVMPARGWLTRNNDIEVNADIVPVPGSYWSQYGFKISVLPTGLSQISFVYINSLSWEDTQEQLPDMSPDYYARVQQVTALYPPALAAMSRQADTLLHVDETRLLAATDIALRKNIVDQIALRRVLVMEDGSEIDTLKLAVFREGDYLLTEVTLLRYADPYPNWSGDIPPSALRLSCRANQDVPLRTFKSLCTLFLERQSMSVKTTNGEACEARRDDASAT